MMGRLESFFKRKPLTEEPPASRGTKRKKGSFSDDPNPDNIISSKPKKNTVDKIHFP